MRRDAKHVFEVVGPPALPAPAELVIEALSPLITAPRRERIQRVADMRTLSVVPVFEHLGDPHNMSAVLRSADAFGIQRVDIVPHDRGFLTTHGVSKGAHIWLDLHFHRDAEACAAALHAEGYRILVATMDGEKSLEDLAGIEKVALVFGNERRGASPRMRDLADGTYAVPMVGFVESLNVSVAAGITLHAATRGRRGNLPDPHKRVLAARYLMNSVRDAERVVREYAEARGVSTP